MIDLGSIMLGSHQPDVLAAFYTRVFGRSADMHEGSWYGWQIGTTFFSIGEHSEVIGKAKEPQRVIFNFQTMDVEEEFERIKEETHAKVIKAPYEMGGMIIATLADPDGNYFQLMSAWEQDYEEEEPERLLN